MSLENNFKIEYSFAEDIISLEPEKYKPLVAKLKEGSAAFADLPRAYLPNPSPMLKALIRIYYTLTSINKDLLYTSPQWCQWNGLQLYKVFCQYVNVVRAAFRTVFSFSQATNDQIIQAVAMKQYDFFYQAIDLEEYLSSILVSVHVCAESLSECPDDTNVRQAHCAFMGTLINDLYLFPTFVGFNFLSTQDGLSAEHAKLISGYLCLQSMHTMFPQSGKYYQLLSEYNTILSRSDIAPSYRLIQGSKERSAISLMMKHLSISRTAPLCVWRLHALRVCQRLVPPTAPTLSTLYTRFAHTLAAMGG